MTFGSGPILGSVCRSFWPRLDSAIDARPNVAHVFLTEEPPGWGWVEESLGCPPRGFHCQSSQSTQRWRELFLHLPHRVSVSLQVTWPIHPRRFPLTTFGWCLILGSVCWSGDLGCIVWCLDVQIRDILKSVEVTFWMPWADKQYLGATISYQASSALFLPSFPKSGQTLWRTELTLHFHPFEFHSHCALPCLWYQSTVTAHNLS